MTTKKAAKPRAAKVTRKPRTVRADRGNLTREETTPLLLKAKDAYGHQCQMGNVPDSMTFDDWRKAEVYALNGKSGISALFREEWPEAMAHFEILNGEDEAAMKRLLKAGRVRDHGPAWDTREKRAEIATVIRENLAVHVELATTTAPIQDEHRARARRFLDFCAGWAGEPCHITGGFVLHVARCRIKNKPLHTLQGLEDALTVAQLVQVLSTVRNRIADHEGRGSAEKRNKSRRTPAAKKAAKMARDPGTLAPRSNDPF